MPAISASASPSLKVVGLLLSLLVLSTLPLLPVHAVPPGTTTVVENFVTDATYVTQGPGPTVNDEATVTSTPGLPAPTGTLTYNFYTNLTCSGAPAFTETVSVGTESSPQGPLPSGSYSFQATYNGDSNYAPSTSACEPVIVTSGTSTTSTVVENFVTDAPYVTSAAGVTVNDEATVVASPPTFAPTGTVTYNFYTNLTCSGAPAFTETVPVGTESSPEGPLPSGSYAFQATYNGDPNYTPSTGACEPITVFGGTSTTTTVVENFVTDATYVTQGPGPTVNDEATVVGSPPSFAPTGTVTYNFYTNPACAGPPAFTETVALGVESSPQGPLPSGSYSFQAVYNGDSNYAPSTGACEPLFVTPGSSTTTTVVENFVTDAPYVTQGAGPTVNDEATVVGSPASFAPTGTVTYNFYTNPACSGAPAFTETLPVGIESSPEGPLPSGLYSFQATYNGDSNYTPSTGQCELVTVSGSTAVPEFPLGLALLFVLLVPALLVLKSRKFALTHL